MAETFGPFDGVPWSQGQWFDFAPTWAPSGVVGTPAASYNVGELSLGVNGLNLTLGTGRAWVRGAGYENDAGKAFAVAANTNASLSRRDRIVLRRDLAAKTVTAIRLAGTPAASPVAPALTQVEGGQWDQKLFSFLVPPNSGTTLSGFVDERSWADPSGTGDLPKPARGVATVTTDGAGLAYIDHSLGRTPSVVILAPGYQDDTRSSVFKPTVGALTSTQIQVVAYRTDAATRLLTTVVQVHWVAWP